MMLDSEDYYGGSYNPWEPVTAPDATPASGPPYAAPEGMHWLQNLDGQWVLRYNDGDPRAPINNGQPPTFETTPTPQTGGGGGSREDIERAGRAYDDANGLMGGYYDTQTGVWVNGSPRSGGGGGGGGRGGYTPMSMLGGSGSYPFPMLDLPSYGGYADYVPEEWVAPDPKSIYDDPSYQFRFDEGMRPIMNWRAGKGLTRTGATMKELARYGQGFASNEYDRIWSRAADSYDRRNASRKDAWTMNRQNRLDAYDRSVNEAIGEFQPRQRWAELQFNRDWDMYKYANDDAFRRWQTEGNWASGGSQYPGD